MQLNEESNDNRNTVDLVQRFEKMIFCDSCDSMYLLLLEIGKVAFKKSIFGRI